ncbi:DUF1579 family protein [Pseudarthrobacter sp902506025]|uniref:DUF1579 domain-containing protein n=1 Tax=Pseudarthrobacter defluvii TaxID=410837 RepID=A0ABT9UP14_9MICC|nr:DUF1579 family protein [Pseudarthrobacter defluvii]MDQ0120728.1 hypothetical protein [Pseudarthrobacter defluvii]
MEQGHPALSGLLGHWRGQTHVAAGPWGPERSVDAEVTYSRVAAGLGVVQSYRHVEPDGSHFEGHGIFTVDPVHNDVLWYYVDSTGVPPGTAARCTWRHGVLRVDRPSDAGWTRHSLLLRDGVLTHVTELRSVARDDDGGTAGAEAAADGRSPAYRPFMRSVFHRA